MIDKAQRKQHGHHTAKKLALHSNCSGYVFQTSRDGCATVKHFYNIHIVLQVSLIIGFPCSNYFHLL